MNKLYKIHPIDNVAVALEPIRRGEIIDGLELKDDLPLGHKVLLHDLNAGADIIKYANPIGHLTCDVKRGSHIHEHNLKTNLTEAKDYKFSGENHYRFTETKLTFDGYLRDNGKAATRNEIWILPTVSCVNNTVRQLEKEAQSMGFDDCDGVFAHTHPYGCSQMGDDQENTRRILAALINHSNAGAVLVVSLGCENTNIRELRKYLGEENNRRVKFLVTQECDDEIEEGKALLAELYDYVRRFKRQPIPADRLVVALKCGGSDALSGITANPLCGHLTDRITSFGGSVILTETPELFGAEHLLMKRAENKAVFDNLVTMITTAKNYYLSHGQVCYENPSPGNHDGGITTLEEKSLGCIQKGGASIVTDVLGYGEKVTKAGLNLLAGPGNDIVSTTNLACAGATLMLFTTGRGTPLGSVIPTVKIASNERIFHKKRDWFDYNAQSETASADELLQLVLAVASGKQTKNETNGYREIAIFKDGVVL